MIWDTEHVQRIQSLSDAGMRRWREQEDDAAEPPTMPGQGANVRVALIDAVTASVLKCYFFGDQGTLGTRLYDVWPWSIYLAGDAAKATADVCYPPFQAGQIIPIVRVNVGGTLRWTVMGVSGPTVLATAPSTDLAGKRVAVRS